MRPKSMILIFIALACGLVASIGISQVMESGKSQDAEKVRTEKIYITTVDVDLGEEINAQMVKVEEWPVDKVPEGAVRTLEETENKRTLTRLFAGEPLLNGKLIDKDKYNDATQQIPAGYRVVAISVTSESSVANLVKPGDSVDVLVFLKGGRGNNMTTRTKTILQAIKVFAVNSNYQREPNAEGEVIHAKNVSLLLEPHQVQKIMLASELGSIKLSLRRGDDAVSDTSEELTIDDLFNDDADTPSYASSGPEQSLQPAGLGGINSFLQGMQASAPVPSDTSSSVGPIWEMQIMSNDGQVQVYTFDDPESLPRELKEGAQDKDTVPVSAPGSGTEADAVSTDLPDWAEPPTAGVNSL